MSAPIRILVLQRPEPPLETVTERLQSWGCALHLCRGAEEMLHAAATLEADLVMIDSAIADGMAVVGAIKSHAATRSLPTITLTTDPRGMIAAEALALGADDVLVVPVDDTELYARVRALSRLARMEVERSLRETVLAEFGVPRATDAPGVPAIDRLGILLIGPAGLEQIQVTTALGAAATVAYAETVERALDRLHGQSLDIAVVTGTRQPADLERLCRAIRADPALFDLPLMLIARADSFSERAQPFEWGVSDVLVQPFHPEVLRLRVQGWVRQQRLRRRLRGEAAGDGTPVTTDRLTRLHGHGFLHAYLERVIARDRHHGVALALVGLDVEGMHRINREHGFAAGDRVLAHIAALIRRSTRADDLPARVGGDRFVVVVAGASARGAAVVAERLQRVVGAAPLELGGGRTLRLAARTGVAELGEADDAASLVERALACLPPPDLRRAS
jgi:two-component system, cell cycle response regulator